MNGGIMHSSLGLVGASMLVLAACQAKPAPFNPDDPVAIAQIDSVMQPAFDAARRADADKVLAMAEGAARPGRSRVNRGAQAGHRHHRRSERL